MATKRTWVVRVGIGSEIVRETRRKRVVAVGWARMGDCSALTTRDEFLERARSVSDEDPGIRSDFGQLYRFAREIQVGDAVLVPNRDTGEVVVGSIRGDYRFDPNALDFRFPHVRDVEWLGVIHQDAMSDRLVASLDSSSVVFSLGGYDEEIAALLSAQKESEGAEMAAVVPAGFLAEARERAQELLTARLNALPWSDFDALVEALLRALTFTVRLTRQDEHEAALVAYPDALGFGEPRIRALVPHSATPATAQQVRAFRMSSGPGERSLFISRSGFGAEAPAEPELSGPPLVLIGPAEFLALLTEHYHNFSAQAQSLLPLHRVYIPAD